MENSTDTSDPTYVGSALWIILFCIIIFLSIGGNLLTIVAISSSRQLNSTLSNQYIFSLAVSDFLVGTTLPYHMCFYMMDHLADHKATCLTRFILVTFACASSILNLFIIATDRFVAVVYPLEYTRHMTRTKSMVLVAFVWISSFGVSSVPISWNSWDERNVCDVKIIPTRYYNFFLTPMFLLIWMMMLAVYIKIWREAKQHTKRLRTTTNLHNSQSMNDRKSIQVVMLTLGCFSICWMPFFIVTTYYRISNSSSKFSLWYEIAFTMAVANSGMNPIIYAWKNSNFREAFKCVLTCRSPDKLKKQSYITNHVPSKKGKPANSETQGHDNVVATIETDDESRPQAQYDECSVATEMSNVATLPRTHS